MNNSILSFYGKRSYLQRTITFTFWLNLQIYPDLLVLFTLYFRILNLSSDLYKLEVCESRDITRVLGERVNVEKIVEKLRSVGVSKISLLEPGIFHEIWNLVGFEGRKNKTHVLIWNHQSLRPKFMKVKFSPMKRIDQNIKSTRPWPQDGIDGSR